MRKSNVDLEREIQRWRRLEEEPPALWFFYRFICFVLRHKKKTIVYGHSRWDSTVIDCCGRCGKEWLYRDPGYESGFMSQATRREVGKAIANKPPVSIRDVGGFWSTFLDFFRNEGKVE